MNMPLKKKYTGSKGDMARGYIFGHTKQFPRQHSGNGMRKPQKNPSGPSVPSENNTYMWVDVKTGKQRMRRR